MFRNINSTKYFFKNQPTLKHLPLKDIYKLNKLLSRNGVLSKYGSKYPLFNNFSIFKNFNTLADNVCYVFLIVFFFFKTQKVTYLNKLEDFSSIRNNSIFSRPVTINIDNLETFWKKWGGLRRPKTEDNYNDYFLNTWKSKFKIYKNLGFLKIHSDFFIICSNCKDFLKKTVNVNKPLLISPKYSSSSINKYISVTDSKNFEFQFLRKNKVYNKGRYSRCRQNYRTGVYMCMYLSVVSIFGLYYWFYKFSFNFTYLWWLFIAFLGSFFLPKIFKYRLYEPNTLLAKFFDFFRWGFLLIKSLFF